MKAMSNWDLFTIPKAEEFGFSHSMSEQIKLSQEWKKKHGLY